MSRLVFALAALFALLGSASAGTGGLISVNLHTAPGVLEVAATGKVIATYTGWTSGAVWLCIQSHTAAVGTSPACAAAGTATAISAAGSGAGVVCTASATTGADVVLDFTDGAQDNVRVRACTTATDVSQIDNANQVITVLAAPKIVFNMPGSAALVQRATKTIRLYVLGQTATQKAVAATWLTFKSHTGTIGNPTGNCLAAGTATAVTTGTGDSSVTAGVQTANIANQASAAIPYVDLTWTTVTQVEMGAKVCTSTGAVGGAWAQSGVMTNSDKIGVTLSPTTAAGGDTITATYLRYDTGAVYLCFRTGTGAVGASPACGAPGTATAITTAGSGAAVVCTASASTGAAVSLTWTDVAQDNIWVRACTSNGDTNQEANSNQALTVAIGLSLSPTSLTVGSSITATYKGWTTGNAWICYKTATAGTLLASPACAAAGTATAINSNFGSHHGIVCTASTTTGAAVTILANSTTQAAIRARVCTTNTDTAQKNNGFDTLTISAVVPSSSATTNTTTTASAAASSNPHTTVTQVYTFPSLTVATYTGNTKGNMECAYANNVEAATTPTWCVAATGSRTYKAGIAMSSTVAARRAAKVTFTLKVDTTVLAKSALETKVATSSTAAKFAAALTAVNTGTGFNITDPGTATNVATATFTSSTSGASSLLPSMLGLVSALFIAFKHM